MESNFFKKRLLEDSFRVSIILLSLYNKTLSDDGLIISPLKYAVLDLISFLLHPINKHNIQSDEFNFPGHTEYLANEFNGGEALMFMVADSLRIGVVTGHIPIADVASSISIEKILKKVDQIERSLKSDFNIRKPKIAVLGLNPHSGDKGIIGKEDDAIILPAVEKAFDSGKLVFGPYSAHKSSVVHSFIKKILSNKSLEIHKDGFQNFEFRKK